MAGVGRPAKRTASRASDTDKRRPVNIRPQPKQRDAARRARIARVKNRIEKGFYLTEEAAEQTAAAILNGEEPLIFSL